MTIQGGEQVTSYSYQFEGWENFPESGLFNTANTAAPQWLLHKQ
jgi:hypothetical protein